MAQSPLIIISGPTATGKTAWSVRLAKHLQTQIGTQCHIINCDSLLFYQHLHIGTARPTKEEEGGITHHLMEVCPLDQEYNAAQFVSDALPLITDIHLQGHIPFVVGGSAFYLRALIKGMYDAPTTPLHIRERGIELLKKEGIAPFIKILEEHDTISFNTLHPNDHYRVVRAVEHWWATGRPISEAKASAQENDPYDFSSGAHPEWRPLHLYLDMPKEEHARIIEARTKKMLADGLISEVQNILQSGISPEAKALGSIGYNETLQFLRGEIKTLRELESTICIHTRQLAKSQRTFFKKIHPKDCFHPINDAQAILNWINQLITK